MYYHIMIETDQKKMFEGYVSYYQYDHIDIEKVVDSTISPFIRGDSFFFNGYNLNKSGIRRIRVTKTQQQAAELVEAERKRLLKEGKNLVILRSAVAIYGNSEDITDEILQSTNEKLNGLTKNAHKAMEMSKVFIVHGHDELAKTEVARYIEKLGFEPIILHEQASSGKTIIEKIEAHSNVGFGIVLYTPCDVGAVKTSVANLQPRARQNVVFEHGYLIGKLGRDKVCALVKSTVEKPNDISGVVYVQMDSHMAWHMKVAKEMKAAGYLVDMNKL